VLPLLFLLSCGPPPDLVVTVVDEDGAPIPGSRVRYADHDAYCADEGDRFACGGSGDLGIVVEALGYHSVEEVVSLGSRRRDLKPAEEHTAVLQRRAGCSGEPVDAVTVTVSEPELLRYISLRGDGYGALACTETADPTVYTCGPQRHGALELSVWSTDSDQRVDVFVEADAEGCHPITEAISVAMPVATR